MWKYIKGTEKDFEQAPRECSAIVKPYFEDLMFYTNRFSDGLYLLTGLSWSKSVHENYDSVAEKEGVIVAQREWIEDPVVETKEEQKPLQDMNHFKDLPKIKLDVKKPIFDKDNDTEVKFIHSNDKYFVFESSDGNIFTADYFKVDTYFYNKPEVKTTVELIADAWRHAQNDGSLWASPTQLFYMAIEQLVKDGIVDMNKVYEVKQ